MKIGITVNCLEKDLHDAIMETIALLNAVDGLSIEIKIYHGLNRMESVPHSYLEVSKNSNVYDLVQIFKLKQRVKELETKVVG